jgi:hypothetical protein
VVVSRTKSLALVVGVVALGAAGCESRLPLEAGNAWRCRFADAPGERDAACPSGWVCGVDDRCREFRRAEIFPCEGACNYPDLLTAGAGIVYPPEPRQPLANVFVEWLGTNSYGVAVRAQGSPQLERLNPQCLRWEPPHPIPSQVSVLRGLLTHRAPDGTLVRLYLDGSNGSVFSEPFGYALDGATPLARVSGLRYLRPTPMSNGVEHAALVVRDVVDPLHPPGLTPAKSVGELELRVGAAGQVRPLFVPYDLPPGETVRDARVLQGPLSARPVLLTDTAVHLGAPGGAAGSWEAFFAPVPDNWRGTRLALGADQETWAVVMEQLVNGKVRHAVSAWRVSTQTPRELFPHCVPCGAGTVEQVVPFTAQGGGVDVFCVTGDGAGGQRRDLVRVVGASGGQCERAPVSPLFHPQAVTAFDDSLGAPVLGTGDGNLWYARSLADAVPYFLERAPTGVSRHAGRLLAFTEHYLAVEVPGDAAAGIPPFGMVVVASGDMPRPAAAIRGLAGGFIFPGGFTVKVDSAAQPGPGEECLGDLPEDRAPPVTFVHGPRLLGPTGQPAEGPYQAEAVEHSTGRVSLAASAGDSLYFEPELTFGGGAGEAPGLIAQLTPEPNFPIRAIAVDQSLRNTASDPRDLHGYLVTSRRLFEFTQLRETRRWTLDELHLTGGEPAGVSMLFRDSSAGRVIYRDGNIFTLPSGFQLVEGQTLGPSARVTSTVNAGGLPLALTDQGVFVARPDDAAPDEAAGERYRLWKWQPLDVPAGHAGFELGTLALLPTADERRPEVYFFDRRGTVVRLGRVEP